MGQAATINPPSPSSIPSVPTSFTTDSGTVIPTSNNMEVLGGTNIATSGAGKVLTLTIDGTVAATNGGTGKSTYAVGDLLYSDTTTSLASLNAGADGEVATVASGVPTWAAASGGGQWELISTATPSGASTVEFTDLAVDEVYRISFENVVASDTAAILGVRASNDNGVSFSSSANYNWTYMVTGLFTTPISDQEDTYMPISVTANPVYSLSNSAGAYGDVYMYRSSQPSAPLRIYHDIYYLSQRSIAADSSTIRSNGGGCSRSSVTVGNTLFDVDAVQLFCPAAETITGTIKLYKSTE